MPSMYGLPRDEITALCTLYRSITEILKLVFCTDRDGEYDAIEILHIRSTFAAEDTGVPRDIEQAFQGYLAALTRNRTQKSEGDDPSSEFRKAGKDFWRSVSMAMFVRNRTVEILRVLEDCAP